MRPAKNARSGAASQRLTHRVLEVWGTRCWLQLPGCTLRATTKDHVIPVDHGGTDDMQNLRPACVSCNSKRQNLAISGAGGIEVTVIVGPPSPQQQEHAHQCARPGDLVIDRDLLADALTAPGSVSAEHIDRLTSKVYATAVHQALRANARCRVWIIHPVPTIRQVQQYARLRYQLITVDPGRTFAEYHATRSGSRRRALDVASWYSRYPDGQESIERSAAHRATAATSPPITETADTGKPSRAW